MVDSKLGGYSHTPGLPNIGFYPGTQKGSRPSGWCPQEHTLTDRGPEPDNDLFGPHLDLMEKRICVVGGGRCGVNHINTLADLGCLGGVVDLNPETLRNYRQRFPQLQTFESLAGAFDAEFDGFVVATPAETHFDLAQQIIELGKPLLVEKPLALTLAEATWLKESAQEKGVNLMVGHLLLFHPAIRKLKQLIQQGEIGRLQYLYSNRLNLGTVRTHENILWSFAPHDLSMFQDIIGTMPIEVVARGGEFLQPGVHDITMTILKYPDNIVAHVFVSWLHPFKEHRIVAIGSKGMLVFEDSSAEKELTFYEKGIDWVRGEPVRHEGTSKPIPYTLAPPLTEELKYFIGQIGRGSVEIANAQHAIEVLEILERATETLLPNQTPPDRKEVDESAETPQFFAHSSSIVDEGVEIGEGTSIWHFSRIQDGAQIGQGCSIGQNVYVGSGVQIGNRVKIQNNVSVYTGLILEDHVFCGPSMVFTNILDPRSKYPQKGSEFYTETLVREGASIGANTTILCGHTIGRHSFVGAGAVVTQDVPDYALMMGVPARRVGWICECGERLAEFSAETTCSRCERSYQASDGTIACKEVDVPQGH